MVRYLELYSLVRVWSFHCICYTVMQRIFNNQDMLGALILLLSLANNITLENVEVCTSSWACALWVRLHHNDVMNQVSDTLHVNDGNLAHYRGVN